MESLLDSQCHWPSCIFLVVLLHSSFLIIFFFLLLSIQRLFLHIIPNGLLTNGEGLGVTLPDVLVVGCRCHHCSWKSPQLCRQPGRLSRTTELANEATRSSHQQPAEEASWSLSRNSGGAALSDSFQVFIRSSWVMLIPVSLMCPVSLFSLSTLLIQDQNFWKLSPN